MRKTALITLVILALNSPAHARHYQHKHYGGHRHHYAQHVRRARGAGRPSAWCGWYMRQLLGVASPAYNLARNWAHYGHATAPHVGAIVVWPHHVGKIVGGAPGHWAVLSGNDGHAVRTRVRSVSGAITFRE